MSGGLIAVIVILSVLVFLLFLNFASASRDASFGYIRN